MAKPKGVRYQAIKDAAVYKLLKKKDEYITQLRSMQEDINKLGDEGKLLGGKVQKIKDKSIPKMEKHILNLDLERNLQYGCPNCKWEVVASFKIEGGEVLAEIIDLIDQEKERILVADEQETQKKSD